MGKFDVGIQALRQDVQIWDQQSGQMTQIVQKVNALRMDRLEAGIFQIFVGAYQDAVNEIVARAGEGSTAMTDVGATLTTVANEYQKDESDNTYRFKDLH
ncbi:MAG TPA: hypothetical protein VG756_03385 [Pseudonocardiaceae bacterium]|jgi:hypothetical protein|nr:hypothetical protein [Pseudonocardiaceae bacterium]